MGINGLLKGLSPLLIPENDANKKKMGSQPLYNIRQFKNKTLAVDASSWLYKACYSASERIVEAIESNRIDPVGERILCKYIIKRCEELLINAGIRRIRLVFDGKRCPLKTVTNQEREAKRRTNLAEARRLNGLGMRDQAQDKYKTCVKVVDWMSKSVAKAVAQKWNKQGGFLSVEPQVTCVFSPYEADAQMVRLCMDGMADAVVTEDSDVLVYSAACMQSFPIIYKLDRNTGDCDVISMDWLLQRCPSSASLDYGGTFSLRRLLHSQLPSTTKNAACNNGKKPAGSALLSHLNAIAARESRNSGSGVRMFVQGCVLSGCDYAPSGVSGIGLVTAFKMIKENIHRDPDCRFLHALKSVSVEKFKANDDDTERSKEELRDEYEELIAKSECVFYFHRVLNKMGKIVPLVESTNCVENLENTPPVKIEAQSFLPKLDRFEDDSFIGDINADGRENVTHRIENMNSRLANTHKSSKLPIPKTNKKPIQNPYSKPASKPTTKINSFAHFAHNALINSSKIASPLKPSSAKPASISNHIPNPLTQPNRCKDSSLDDEFDELLQPVARNERKSNQFSTFMRHEKDLQPPISNMNPPRLNRCNGEQPSHDSDSSSDDELDEVLRPERTRKVTQKSDLALLQNDVLSSDDEMDEVLQPVTRNKSIHEKLTILVSKSSQQPTSPRVESQDAKVDPKPYASKYFFSEGTTPLDKARTETSDSNKPSTITPTMSQLQTRVHQDDAKDTSDYLSDKDILTHVSHSIGVANQLPSVQTIEDSSDDEDCIFVESSRPSNIRSISLNSRYSLSQSSRTPSIFSSTFTRAQREGTRARIDSRIRKFGSGSSTGSKTGALGRPKKKLKNTSIKGFFSLLPTKIDGLTGKSVQHDM